ncbi:phosphonate C-P lyase system protein PhnH [Marinobacter lacisalsi]|uniref:Phosphonate C-P lyase system protein PhnH n=1 Tax=Marinobacter lacisalsi TaxID=475979 RepID=A0ABV8QGH2_9GAMM
MENLNQQTRSGLPLDELCTGLAEPVSQSQQIFRQVLTALSEPGTRLTLAPVPAPKGIHSAAYQVCLALLDADTPLWVSDSLATPSLLNSLRFHCGCRVTHRREEAIFAVASPGDLESIAGFSPGSHEYPDRSTTVILQVDHLHSTGPWRLSGPGIEQPKQVGIEGLANHWPAWLRSNRASFPLGVDLLLTDGNSLMGLPRTTLVEVESCM